ncbi:cytochrome c oxidase subunit II [Methylocystis suflitae]|uniref:cytochrome c oxidase subunit II n=1 Tax=Methylocystis suflitae TaxID=2951405 RepID=UPI002108637F|nr:cytochrome c oxidase subunit II [Methylocystis suflitae]MCQ4188645.1 cytochrome c oxidase subunit II [Methylocystis suflitae]
MPAARSLFVVGISGALAGCSDRQSALAPHAAEAQDLLWLTVLFIVLLGAIWLIVMIALAIAMLRRRDDNAKPSERVASVVISICAGLTGLIVIGLTVVSFAGQREMQRRESPLLVRIIGHQWWWELRYADDGPNSSFVTANELRLPAGRDVVLNLESADVIHSFWAPNLAGKKDLIPGRVNELKIRAPLAGVYRAQCAEFCGLQHAHMGLDVVVENPDRFEEWRVGQATSGRAPQTEEQRFGQDVFLTRACFMCHAIRGTKADGLAGPDLTHFASRRTLAAALLPRTTGATAGWIADPQQLKPGAHMPRLALSPKELNAVVAYLESLE